MSAAGYIYLIATESPLAFKVGFTRNDPRVRVRQLQTGCPSELVLMGWYPATDRDERDLHEKLAPSRVRGEWFHLDDHANEVLRGPVACMQINNRLAGYEP